MKQSRFRCLTLCLAVIYLICTVVSALSRLPSELQFEFNNVFAFRTLFCVIIAALLFIRVFLGKELYMNATVPEEKHAHLFIIELISLLLWAVNINLIIVETWFASTDSFGDVCIMIATMTLLNVVTNTLKMYQPQ